MAARPVTEGRSSRDRHVIAFGLGVLLVAALVVLLPDLTPSAGGGLISDQAHGVIVTISPPTGPQGPTGTVRFLDGPQAGQTVPATIEGPSGALQIPDYHVGDEVLVAIDHLPDGTAQVSVVDRWRLPLIGGLIGLFALVTVVVAGWRGMRALVSLALTLVLAIRVLIPLLLSGWQPVGLAISLGILITAVSFLLTQGLTRITLAAILGTSIGLGLTGLLAVLVTGLAQFTPAQGSETVIYLQQIVGDKIDLSGLLLAAVIFGALGVLNDVAIGQAATVEELALADPGLSRRQLYGRAMNVGVAHLAATVNTLVFAYLGTALPLLVLLSLQLAQFSLSVNQELVAVEIVRAAVGSVGILAAVPATTAIAAWWHEPPKRAAVVRSGTQVGAPAAAPEP
ncbi:MAG TPA: YibE/F family protein [Candidatus Sulfotelmatobacter sp.]|nr:YibE/F family protein [Candidatus Sulfotelmatobacter sp.]